MAKGNDRADDLISGSLKRSKSYHKEYGKKPYKEIEELVNELLVKHSA